MASNTRPRLSVISGPADPALLDWTFNDLLREQLRRNATNVAIISQHQKEIITYAELDRRAGQLAAGLYALGIRKNDRVGVLLGNRSEYGIVSEY